MNIHQLRDNYTDDINMEYLESTVSLTYNDLKDRELMVMAYVLSYTKPCVFSLREEDTTKFYSKNSTPITFSSIRIKDGHAVLYVRGKDTNRIRKKWTKRFRNLVGHDFEEVKMEFVQ